VPPAARQALALESGLNDVVLLPIVLIAIALLPSGQGVSGMGRMAVGLFLLGPGAGVLIGFLGVVLLDRVRKSVGVRRDYESLYALGVACAAYAAGEALHASGFLAAFAAGFTIAVTDAELCDCFLDFGQAAAEMFLLFTFVAFGGSLIWTGFEVLDLRTLAFAAVALGGRSLVLLVALARTPLDARSRRLIVWYGPRGLSTLLLVLLPVFAGARGAGVDELFAIASLVVLLSVVLHGGALMILGRTKGAGPAASSEPAALTVHPERITIPELLKLQAAGERVVVLDVRTERSFRESDTQARGAVRIPPDGAAERAAELALPREAWLVAYCT
jgi:NhaP-type Na+/H+ or K+/H+ antiporter